MSRHHSSGDEAHNMYTNYAEGNMFKCHF